MLIPLKASVVIPTCNRPSALADCLRSLTEQQSHGSPLPPESYEIIVTDDGTHQSAEQAIGKLFPAVIFTLGPKRGPAANRNAGASRARGELLIFIDDDCICSNSLVQSYIEASLTNPEDNVFEGRTSAVGEPNSHAAECPVNESGGYLWSCNLAIRKQLFQSMGGFDEQFRYAAFEDVDLRYRLAAIGQKSIFIRDAQVFHPWENRTGWERVRKHRMSQLIFLTKHPLELKKMETIEALGLPIRIMLRETLRGIPKYRLRNISQRFRNLVGDFYVLFMRSALKKGCTQRRTGILPKRWQFPSTPVLPAKDVRF